MRWSWHPKIIIIHIVSIPGVCLSKNNTKQMETIQRASGTAHKLENLLYNENEQAQSFQLVRENNFL